MASSVGNLIGMYSSRKKNREGRQMMREAQENINNFEWQDIESAIPIRMEGIQMLREENARMSATAMDALRSGGTRGLGSVADIISYGNQMNQQARAALEDQYIRRDYTRLGMMERRQADELAGYGQMLNVGLGMKYQGLADMYNTAQSQGQENKNIMSMIMGGLGVDS